MQLTAIHLPLIRPWTLALALLLTDTAHAVLPPQYEARNALGSKGRLG